MNGEGISMITTESKITYALCPCPWCKKTPSLNFYFVQGTWLPKIRCDNSICPVQPESKSFPIRKTCKVSYERLVEKMDALFKSWNTFNPLVPYEGKEIDFNKIIEEGMKDEQRRKERRI